MNPQRQSVCPKGYVWITNISYTYDSDFIHRVMGINTDELFQRTKDKLRKKYGDVQVVTPAYANDGTKLNGDTVALYVPHQGLRRIQKWLRNHNKLKGRNLPY